ncbi:MAG: hypothetical protein EHM61_05525 [Acidobacteria bacterium]|nr:MAG: hypothetical protein EHM61_05525 [Acidobacteriota bacterium]
MNCEDWRIQIGAFLDGSCDPKMVKPVRTHLDTCSSCLAFYREQSDLNALLGSSALEIEPPQHLWYRIESRMHRPEEVSAVSAFVSSLFRFWNVPKLRYALISSLLLLVVSWSLLEFRANRESDRLLLAQIDAYHFEVKGNPFLSQLEKTTPPENPFLDLGASTSNPFLSKGSSQ